MLVGGKPLLTGKVGKEVDLESAKEAAKIVGLNLCATLKHNLGDLDKVKRIVKLVTKRHFHFVSDRHSIPDLILKFSSFYRNERNSNS